MQRRSAQIAGELEQEILAGKLPPGERLPSEEKFCERFGVSRTVIREAIQQLRDEWEPRPWADGARNLYFKLAWSELSGRRLGSGWTSENETPVQRLVGAS